jgi:SAM-dependent methyltransferase
MVDFSRTAQDYACYRTDFPPELFTRLAALGVGGPGARVADVGTGTGVLARGFATRGCAVTGVDVSVEMVARARRLGGGVTYRVGAAEDTGLAGGAWDVVSAGQCWHWLDRDRAAAQAHRLLVPGGALVICYRDYVVEPGNVCAVSEELVLAHNPTWPLVGTSGRRQGWSAELTRAGFLRQVSETFVVDERFTHEQWRGRMRSSSGVGASLSDTQVAAFDTDLARLLAHRFPEPLVVAHDVWLLVAYR